MAEFMKTKDKVQEIINSIEDGLTNLFESNRYKEYLKTMSKFYKYSVNNCYLIFSQNPNATLVAGYDKWNHDFKRSVKKGEKGIRIIVPAPYNREETYTVKDPSTGEPVLDSKGNPVKKTETKRVPGFKTAYVFDVSQTEGKDLPEIVGDIKGDVENYEIFIEALKRVSPVPVIMGPEDMKEDGLFSPKDQSITIKSNMSEKRTLAALVHEITHSKLHNYSHPEYAGIDASDSPKAPSTQEVEAESVAYAVCGYYGIETGENSLGYIALWSKDKGVSELRASLDTISRTAGDIIYGVDSQYCEIMKEKNKTIGKVYPNSFLSIMRDLEYPGNDDRFFVGRCHMEDDGRHIDSVLYKGTMDACADTFKRLNDEKSLDEKDIISENNRKWAKSDEALFTLGPDMYLHVAKKNDGITFDYTLYDKNTYDLIDGGVTDAIEPCPGGAKGLKTAAELIAESEGYKKGNIENAPSKLIDTLKEHDLIKTMEKVSKTVSIDNTPVPDEVLHKSICTNFPGKCEKNPDPTMVIGNLYAVGYTGMDMYPLGKIRANELLHEGFDIYRVGMGLLSTKVSNRNEIDKWDGIFGIKRCEWDKASVRPEMSDTDISGQISLNYSNMSGRDSYCIFQSDKSFENEKNEENKFYLAKHCGIISAFAEQKDEIKTLEGIRDKFSHTLPFGYLGRPLETGDVISVKRGGIEKCFRMETNGFCELKDFSKTLEKTAEKSVYSSLCRAKEKSHEHDVEEAIKTFSHNMERMC